MSTIWREFGLSYITYSNIAAKVLRKSLKEEFKKDAARRDICSAKITRWMNGKPIKNKR